MKPLNVMMVLFAFAMLTACKGVTTFDESIPAEAGMDAVASDAGQDVIVIDVQADADAQVEAEAQAEAGIDADAQSEAEAGSKTLLTISFNGPPSSTLYPGQKATPFLNASFCAAEELVAQELNYVFGAGISTLFDSNGAPYFTNIRLVDMDNGNTVMGPKELLTYVDQSQVIPFNEEFTLNKGCRSLSLVADVAPSISECTGCLFRAQLWIPANGLGLVTRLGEPLTSDQIIPTTHIDGNMMTIATLEPYVAYCEPSPIDPIGSYTGCCGTFTKVSPGDLKVGDLIKAEGYHPPVYFFGSDGKRYVFPTSVELDSWFAPLDMTSVPVHNYHAVCKNVLELTEVQLAAIPLGNPNVTKRPGAYITGITSLPTRYVVDFHHVLHEASPALLEQIYPGTVPARIYLTGDAFFGNYTMGSSLTSADEYVWLLKYPSTDLEVELGIKP